MEGKRVINGVMKSNLAATREAVVRIVPSVEVNAGLG